MADEGSKLEMTELILEEKELEAKLAVVEQKLEAPMARLKKAKEIYDKAKAALEGAIDEVKPLKSEKTLIEGELELLAEKKSKLRQEVRLQEAGGLLLQALDASRVDLLLLLGRFLRATAGGAPRSLIEATGGAAEE